MNLKLLAICGALLVVFVTAPSDAQTPKPDNRALAASGILERLAERSGVYGVPPTAKVPGFIADAGWPQRLPNNWIIGQVGGLYVAPDDHIWICPLAGTVTLAVRAGRPPARVVSSRATVVGVELVLAMAKPV